jgi:hypothetical protein
MMTLSQRIRVLRAAAKRAGYRLHYDGVGESYHLHGPDHRYGLTLSEAEAAIAEAGR